MPPFRALPQVSRIWRCVERLRNWLLEVRQRGGSSSSMSLYLQNSDGNSRIDVLLKGTRDLLMGRTAVDEVVREGGWRVCVWDRASFSCSCLAVVDVLPLLRWPANTSANGRCTMQHLAGEYINKTAAVGTVGK